MARLSLLKDVKRSSKKGHYLNDVIELTFFISNGSVKKDSGCDTASSHSNSTEMSKSVLKLHFLIF